MKIILYFKTYNYLSWIVTATTFFLLPRLKSFLRILHRRWDPKLFGTTQQLSVQVINTLTKKVTFCFSVLQSNTSSEKIDGLQKCVNLQNIYCYLQWKFQDWKSGSSKKSSIYFGWKIAWWKTWRWVSCPF